MFRARIGGWHRVVEGYATASYGPQSSVIMKGSWLRLTE